MAGSGHDEGREEEGPHTKRHKRSHSRNKSISGRHGFVEEITNGSDLKTAEKEQETGEGGAMEALINETKVEGKQEEEEEEDDEKKRTSSKLSSDEPDALPASLRYNLFDFSCTIISMVTYLGDLVMDCLVAYYFYHLSSAHDIHHYWYFGLTVFFIVLPSLTMTGFSFRWYLMDSDNSQLPQVSVARWLVRLVVLVLQVAPVLRYLDSMRYGVLSRLARAREEAATEPEEKERHRRERLVYYKLMVYEDADATLLRLYESFMESAPQLVLQIYILLKDPYAGRIFPVKAPVGEHHPLLTEHTVDISSGVNPYLKLSILVLSVTTSLTSLAWSLVVYHRSLRYTDPHKHNISLLGTLFQFLWHFGSITARVLALSLFATAMPLWIGPLCAAHWVIMASWVLMQKTAACNTRCEEFLFALVLGVIYIFMFFNAKEEKTRYKYLIYYTFCFIENSVIILIWFSATPSNTWYVLPALAAHYLAFLAGIMFMLCYYLWFHPTGVDITFLKLTSRKKVPDTDVVEPTELVVLTREPEQIPRRQEEGGGLLMEAESGVGAKQMASCEPDNAAPRAPVLRSLSTPANKETSLSAARKLKYMGQKSHEGV